MNNHNKELPSNRKFGILFFIIFLIISVYSYSSFSFLASCILVILTIIIGMITLLNPNILQPFNNAWMSLGLMLNKIISPIIMGFIFFFLITPISLFGYCFGRDELRLKKSNKKSYWLDRKDIKTNKFSFYKQF